jgi:hypothetical protein
MDKFLAELAVLDVGDAMWEAHGATWATLTKAWAGNEASWTQVVGFIDTCVDAYHSSYFARCSKVSSLNTVMPALSRCSISGGPGAPLYVETFAGNDNLSKNLEPWLKKCDDLFGKDGVGALKVVDAGICSAANYRFLRKSEHSLITPVKGKLYETAVFVPTTEFEKFDDNGEVRSGTVTLTFGKTKTLPGGTLNFRAVQMVRPRSRRPDYPPTLFITTEPERLWMSPENIPVERVDAMPHVTELMSPTMVAQTYLRRWQWQEGQFRNLHGAGIFKRSHGYGGTFVTNIVSATDLQRAEASVLRGEARLKETKSEVNALQAQNDAMSKKRSTPSDTESE